MRLTESFYKRKVAALQAALAERNLGGQVIFDHHQIYYLVGFFFTPTERPIILFVPRDGEPTLFVPKLEENYVHEGGWVPDVEVYFEFPGVVHPVDWMCQRLTARGFGKARLGFEGGLSVSGYSRLREQLPDVRWTQADIVSDMRLIKDPEEIELHRKAASYSDYMVQEGVKLMKSGAHPSEADLERHMSDLVIARMQAEMGDLVVVSMLAGALVNSGPRSAFPHGLPSSRRPGPGDNLILSVGCAVGGYFAESERTFFIGEPTAQQRERFEAARNAQEIGFRALQPGARCSDANRQCLDSIRAAGMGEFIMHRQGHGIGIQNHEPPWVEDGDHTILQPGMVVSCEPGIYCPGQGGYRISDTVLVTPHGPERLTCFPRDIESAIIGVD